MNIEWLRDLFICILGGVGTIAFIIIAVIFFKIYLRLNSILNSAKAVACNIEDITAFFKNEVMKPLIQIIAIIQGVRKGVETMSHFCKKEGGKDG